MPPATTPRPSADPAAPAKKILRLTGVVESDKRHQTRRVVVSYQSPHPKYGKYITRRTIIQAHDEKNESRLGDTVEVIPCRPISKTKQWTVARIVTVKPKD